MARERSGKCPECGGAVAVRSHRVDRRIVVGLYLLAIGLAGWLGGSVLHDLAEGLRRDDLPLWKLAPPLLVLALAVMAQVRRRLVTSCEACRSGEQGAGWSAENELATSRELARPTRRAVLRTMGGVGTGVVAGVGGLGAAVVRNRGWLPVADDFFRSKVEVVSPHPLPEWADSRVRSYRRLGRTGVEVSDISLGAGRIHDVAVARLAIERGINYFDTAPDYSDTRSEQVLGEAMKGQRDRIFLATKFCVGDGHLLNDTPVPKVIEAVEQSLRRLQTDYVDLIHIHSCDRLDRLMAPNIHEAFDRLKEQGKVRFLGVSSHTPNLEEVANAAIDSGRFDVMMLAYHYGMWPNFGHILERAREKDVGIVAMKTLKGAKHTNLAGFRDESASYAQAAFRWVLSNPAVACLVISIYEQRQIDEYLMASGSSPRPADVALLDRYDQLTRGDYCQPHCGLCLGSCDQDLPIHDILRYRMYFRDYHWESEGRRLYSQLERNASVCADCSAPCAGSCPIGVPIQEKMADAHRWLS